jgi:hypothetical protein
MSATLVFSLQVNQSSYDMHPDEGLKVSLPTGGVPMGIRTVLLTRKETSPVVQRRMTECHANLGGSALGSRNFRTSKRGD